MQERLQLEFLMQWTGQLSRFHSRLMETRKKIHQRADTFLGRAIKRWKYGKCELMAAVNLESRRLQCLLDAIEEQSRDGLMKSLNGHYMTRYGAHKIADMMDEAADEIRQRKETFPMQLLLFAKENAGRIPGRLKVRARPPR